MRNFPKTSAAMGKSTDWINVICILWGDKYTQTDVNRLHSMILRNTSYPVRFHLFTDELLPGINSRIIRHSEPGLDAGVDHSRYSYRKEAALCDENLGGLAGQRVFFFDLDVVVMDGLDELFAYPEGDRFYIINDWNTRGCHVGQATCYSFVVGTLGEIKRYFEQHAKAIMAKHGTASQEYLSEMVIRKYGKLEFWPEAWFKSFRFHCLPWGFLRHFMAPAKPPAGTKVLAFHGHPDIQDALAGRWSPPDIRKAARGWKKIYKPTSWIAEYWG